MKKKKKIGYLILITLVIVLISLVAVLINILTNEDIKKEKNYTSLDLSKLGGNYKNGKDFILENEINIDGNLSTQFYRPNVSRFFVDKDILVTRANQMGFNKESANAFTEIYIWNKNEDLNSEYIRLNEKNRELSFNYSKGINDAKVDENSAYNIVKEYFGLKILDGKLLKSLDGGSGIKTLYYGIAFDNKNIYFDSGEELFTSIVLNNGKIIAGSLTLIPSDLSLSGELRPVKKVNSENINDLKYNVIFQNSYVSNEIDFTGNLPIGRDTKIVLSSYVDTFYYYIENKQTYILPAIELKGEYIDNNNNKGEVRVIVINQALN